MDCLNDDSKKPRNPREKANIFSALTFLWTLGIFWEGSRRELYESDLYEPLEEHTSNKLGNIFEKYWREEEEIAKKGKHKPSLLKVILKTFGVRFLLYGIVLGIIELILKVAQPLFLGYLIRYFSPGSTISKQEAYFYATGVIACSALAVLALHPYMMAIMHIGMKIRIASCSVIYRKALRLSRTALGHTTVGQVINLLSNDVNRFDVSVMFLHYLWVAPIQTVIVLYFLWQQIGIASIVGLVTIIIFIPFQAWLGQKVSQLRMRTAIRTDERVRLMNEIIAGIQVIKMYAWEIPFAKLVSDARKKEMKEIRNSNYIRGIMLSFIIFHSRLAIFSSIFAYVMFGNQINAEKVFVVTSFFNVLRATMTVFLPNGITQVAEVLVSIKRLQTFLTYDERILSIQEKVVDSEKMNGKTMLMNELTPLLLNTEKQLPLQQFATITFNKGIELKRASARWFADSTENTLTNINLRVEPGKLTAIIGTVGSGKTSLLHAILQELPLTEGSLEVGGVISYSSQEPWLFASSVRQNILFGLDFNRERYRKIVKVCALKTDFDQFPYGDKTIVGERGVSLSGGQRARINLARAIYKQADIYLLDDPLSAVDTHVGKHIFEKCITGYLKNKTVILVTHQLQYLSSVNHIVFMENGMIKAEGNYQQIQENDGDFTKSISNEQEDKPKLLKKDSSGGVLRSRHTSTKSVGSLEYEEILSDDPLEIEEMRSEGNVGSKVYLSYFSAGGGGSILMFMVFMLVLTQLLASGGDYWITFWVNLEEYSQNHPDFPFTYISSLPFPITREICLYVFSILALTTMVVTLCRSFLFFHLCTRASMRLHNDMFNSITRATMRFFNLSSSGQILNRFSRDMGYIDEMLPGSLVDCWQIGLTLIGIITVVSVVNYLLLIPTVFIAILFYYLRIFYLNTSRSIKRLEGITRSPVFGHLSASIQGLTTIRAFQAQTVLEMEFDRHQDLHSSAYYVYLAASRAFAFWLDLVCIIYIGIVTYSFLTLDLDDVFGGNVGLAITQSIGLTGMFQWGMRQSAELENQMTSVERVLEYTNLESEPDLESKPDKKPPDSWPEEGRIVFSRVFMNYGLEEEPPVLKDLNFVIQPKEKIGIVGRTGAGKSSLMTAFFRLTEIQGEILIDDININSIGLHDLRSRISIIPQEPVLFSGTIRKNLDPFDEYSDHLLWKALEEVELKEAVNELSAGLYSVMSEGGSNFSVGQRQLICLARAIVRNNRVLVMDEATANVDPQTDVFIQKTIRQKFADCTVLTIAHRLYTVMDSDKILVMSNGCAMEYDHPHILLQDNNSILYNMVGQMGRAAVEKLHRIAADEQLTVNGSAGCVIFTIQNDEL